MQTGISPKMAMYHASHSTKGTIPLISTKMGEKENYFVDQEKRLSLEQEPPMLFSFGDASLTEADRKELIALFSGTKDRLDQATLSDRQTLSLLQSGLVKGITPMSTRKKLKAIIPDFVLRLPDGAVVEQRETGFSYWKKETSHDRKN